VRHIFKLEQQEYDKEAINWTKITFKDNQATLDMLSEKPLNVLALIDEESRFPKGTDETLLAKLHENHSAHPNYVKPKSRADPTFGISHFAGVVFYYSPGFLDKNRDTFSTDLLNVVAESKNKFFPGMSCVGWVLFMFPHRYAHVYLIHPSFALDSYSIKPALFDEEIKMGAETRKKSPTLGAQFKKSLDQLMKTLGACNPFFVRCVKPNEMKQPGVFDRLLCTRQLRYSGIFEYLIVILLNI
jgi:myosin-7